MLNEQKRLIKKSVEKRVILQRDSFRQDMQTEPMQLQIFDTKEGQT